MSLVSLLGWLTTLLLIAVPTAAAILVGAAARGRARLLGTTGFGLFAVEGVLGVAWLLLAPRLVSETDVSVALLSAVYSSLRSVLAVLAIVLLASAVLAGADRGATGRTPVR